MHFHCGAHYASFNLFAVPGVVSNFRVEVEFISVVFEWDPPQDPNGLLTAYELTYRVNGSKPAIWNFTDSTTMFTLDLAPSTNVSDISVHAYTSAGPGNAVMAEYVMIPDALTPRELVSYNVYTLHIIMGYLSSYCKECSGDASFRFRYFSDSVMEPDQCRRNYWLYSVLWSNSERDDTR